MLLFFTTTVIIVGSLAVMEMYCSPSDGRCCHSNEAKWGPSGQLLTFDRSAQGHPHAPGELWGGAREPERAGPRTYEGPGHGGESLSPRRATVHSYDMSSLKCMHCYPSSAYKKGQSWCEDFAAVFLVLASFSLCTVCHWTSLRVFSRFLSAL